jgi:hypothetical protein
MSGKDKSCWRRGKCTEAVLCTVHGAILSKGAQAWVAIWVPQIHSYVLTQIDLHILRASTYRLWTGLNGYLMPRASNFWPLLIDNCHLNKSLLL